MVNGDRNSEIFISIRKLLLGILKVVLGWNLMFQITGAAKSTHFRAELTGRAGRNGSCLSAHGNRALLGVWVFSKVFLFLGWLLKLL